MNRKLLNGAAAAILSIIAAGSAVAGDYSQLAASARIGAAEASAMTLDEIAARKFSREGRDNAQAASGFAAARAVQSSRTGRADSLDAFHVRMIHRGVSGDERQILPEREAFRPDPSARAQLAASAGIETDAAGLSLDAIALRKFNREADGDNRHPVRE